ncbi:hypothetical protein ABKY47_004261 [Aeromonas hydrophila]
MLDLYQCISVLGDKNIQQQWMRVAWSVKNIGLVLFLIWGVCHLTVLFMADVGDSDPLLRYLLFFRQAPIARIFIFIEAGISSG